MVLVIDELAYLLRLYSFLFCCVLLASLVT